MKKAIRVVSILGVVGLLTACASTSMYSLGQDHYKAVTVSSSEGSADKAGIKKATKLCKEKGDTVRVVSSKTIYQGMDKKTAGVLNLVGGVLGAGPAGSRSDDYKNILDFRCVHA